MSHLASWAVAATGPLARAHICGIVSCNSICFLKFVVYKMNSKMVKSRIVVLTGREKIDMTDADVFVSWMF
jgi:hypothetical protein